MVRAEVVERKLAAMANYLDELRALRPSDLQEYQKDLPRRRAVERLLQLIVEVATDINTHLAAESGEVPDDYFESFWSAARLGAIDDELARATRALGRVAQPLGPRVRDTGRRSGLCFH